MAREYGQRGRKNQEVPSLDSVSAKHIYSDVVKIYVNKVFKELLLVMVHGIAYFIETDSFCTKVKPFNFMDDLSKVIYSDRYPNYLALKLRDLRKFGDRDHIIFEINNLEILTGYMISQAQKFEDDIMFENNDEFSIIVNYMPVWFSFDELNKCKSQEALHRSNQELLSGVLEIRQNKTLNMIKSLFKGQRAFWTKKQFVLQGYRLYQFEM